MRSVLAGAAAIPLLPVARAQSASTAGADAYFSVQGGDPRDPGDPRTCEYWRHCAFSGYACDCCGGGISTCPPGTTMSQVTWLGTCINPHDKRAYLISYSDCCGKPSCDNGA
ncbi:methylamine dehydrogenase light chain [Sphingobium sp. CECT 9361]|uniref:methylamine dehydrogenase light chain n=1 Tax=Sphingobium sp. CECT 9361 TaxID=2845384 RepID=UPI001E498ACA|nr:methylamine dehydrogenase light chain [Sphingobium sp. CECT 9361]